MTKGQYDNLSKMKDNEVQMTSWRPFILVKSELEYKLHFILVTDTIGLFPRFP